MLQKLDYENWSYEKLIYYFDYLETRYPLPPLMTINSIPAILVGKEQPASPWSLWTDCLNLELYESEYYKKHRYEEWDIYLNGHGNYYVYTEDNKTYIQPRQTCVQGLPDRWLPSEDKDMVIIEHEVSKFLGIDEMTGRKIYENRYGTYDVFEDDEELGYEGFLVVVENTACNLAVWDFAIFRWLLIKDYDRIL